MTEIFDDRSGCDVIKEQVFGVQAGAVCAMVEKLSRDNMYSFRTLVVRSLVV
jgi:hypothetical protein